MSVAVEVATSAAGVVEHRPWWQRRLVLSGAIVGLMLVLYFALRGEYPWPGSLQWNSLGSHLDNFQAGCIDQRNAAHPNVVFRAFNGFATFLDDLVTWLNNLFHWLTWVGTTVAGVAVVLRFGGVRAAAWVLGAFASFALLGLWEESIQTLALMFSAVLLSLLVGMPLGVLAGRSDRFARAITPVLDAMQIVPAFAYLMPVVIFFSVGPGAAVITTMIYAVPPAVRITALGIRGRAAEHGRGRTGDGRDGGPGARQGRDPARPQDAPARRQPDDPVRALDGRDRGADRRQGARRHGHERAQLLSGARVAGRHRDRDHGDRVRPRDRGDGRPHRPGPAAPDRRAAAPAPDRDCGGRAGGRPRRRPLPATFGAGAVYSDWTKKDWVLARIQSVLDYVQNPSTFVFHITEPIGNFLVQRGLVPLRDLFVDTPWFVTVAGLTALALVVSGRRAAVTALAMLSLIGVVGEWATAMETLSQVLVATLIAVLLGLALGVWAAESRTVSRILRPVNDVLQTLPQLVYIIPFIYLMPVSIVPGMMAGILYAFPVVARLVENGIRGVEPNTVEAAERSVRLGARCS